jgi:hypothetical protein
MQAGYVVLNTADVALTAATAKSILAAVAAANAPLRLTELSVSFDGVSGAAEPVTVELCASTQATAGTNTSFTPVQTRGRTRTVQAAGAVNYTAEPTTLTVIKTWLVHPQTGMVLQFPLGREPESSIAADAEALIVRCTAPAAVNVRGYIEFEEG